jgi:hypothetical protein
MSQEDSLATSVLTRLAARHPALLLQAVYEPDDRCLVDVELVGQVDLCYARIAFDQNQQTEYRRTDFPIADCAAEVAPQRDLCASHVVAEQVREYSDTDRRTRCPSSIGWWWGAVGAVSSLAGVRHGLQNDC